MKVFVLGGYGKTGLPAVKLLAQGDLVSQIAIAGRDLERADEATREVGEKAAAVQVNGDDSVLIPKMWVRAVGSKEGRAARHTCWFTGHMWNIGGYFLTSAELAAAVRMVLRGEIKEPGVITAARWINDRREVRVAGVRIREAVRKTGSRRVRTPRNARKMGDWVVNCGRGEL